LKEDVTDVKKTNFNETKSYTIIYYIANKQKLSVCECGCCNQNVEPIE